MSAVARKKIALAQKARWAVRKKAAVKKAPVAKKAAVSKAPVAKKPEAEPAPVV